MAVSLSKGGNVSLSKEAPGLTNILIGGCIPTLKKRLKVPIVVTLQGDDVFLDYLPPRHREESIRWIRQIAEHVDGFLVYSQFYADYMRRVPTFFPWTRP